MKTEPSRSDKKTFGVAKKDIKTEKGDKCYTTWRDMLRRCYDKKYHIKKPTYKDIKVCKKWLTFSNFKKWFDKNYRFDLEEKGIKLQLDKDLLKENSKIYSPKTCVFIPDRVNSFIRDIQTRENNTSGYTGLSYDKKTSKWYVRITDFYTHKNISLGLFENKNMAVKAYEKARKLKAEIVKEYLTELHYDETIVEKIR